MSIQLAARCFTAPKWSLTGDRARAVYGVKTGAFTACSVANMKWALENSTEFRAAPFMSFESFAWLNGIEIID